MHPYRDGIQRCESRARHNHGVIARQNATNEGLTDAVIVALVREGRWHRILPRAYVVAGAPITWRTRLAAVQASLGNRFAFSHRTAGALLSLDAVPTDHVEIVTPRSVVLPDVQVHRIRGRWPRTIHIEGFPVTTAARTAIDLFAVMPTARAELALEDALRKKLTSIDRLWSQCADVCRPGRNGCKAFRRALLRRDNTDGTLASRMEAKLRVIMDRIPGCPAVPQFEVRPADKCYRIDFAYPDIKLGIEAHSIGWHLGDVRFHYDLVRHRLLTRSGWTLLYYSMDDLLRPDSVATEIGEVRAHLEARLLDL